MTVSPSTSALRQASIAQAAPTAQSYAVYDELVTQIDAELRKLSEIMKTQVPAFNQLVRDQNIPAVVVKSASNP